MFQSGTRNGEREASAWIRRHQAYALAPVKGSTVWRSRGRHYHSGPTVADGHVAVHEDAVERLVRV